MHIGESLTYKYCRLLIITGTTFQGRESLSCVHFAPENPVLIVLMCAESGLELWLVKEILIMILIINGPFSYCLQVSDKAEGLKHKIYLK